MSNKSFKSKMTDNIPNEVYREILSWIPAEPLLRFRYVCKEWLNIIDDPHFIKIHLHRQTRNQQLILLNNQGSKLFFFSLDSLDSRRQCTEIIETSPLKNLHRPLCELPVTSCHGLMLFSGIIWNPFTREFLELPMYKTSNEGLSFLGLYYDSIADNYKVVRISHAIRRATHLGQETLICCLKYKFWRCVYHSTRMIKPAVPHKHDVGVFANGKLHWLAEYVNCDLHGFIHISYFDVVDETHHVLELPSSFYDQKRPGSEYMDVLGECLFLRWWSEKRGTLDVWVLKSYSGEDMWNKLFSFPQSIMISTLPRPIAYLQNEGRVLMRCGTAASKNNEVEFMWVDVKKKSIAKVIIGGIDVSISFQVFTASLVRLSPKVHHQRLRLGITHQAPVVAPNRWLE